MCDWYTLYIYIFYIFPIYACLYPHTHILSSFSEKSPNLPALTSPTGLNLAVAVSLGDKVSITALTHVNISVSNIDLAELPWWFLEPGCFLNSLLNHIFEFLGIEGGWQMGWEPCDWGAPKGAFASVALHAEDLCSYWMFGLGCPFPVLYQGRHLPL